MDIRKGDVVSWPTNLGWMMGPWLVYASLFNGGSMALYNGAPLGSGFVKFVQVTHLFAYDSSDNRSNFFLFKFIISFICDGSFIQDAKVTMLGVIPSIVRTWKSSNCTAGCDWSSIRYVHFQVCMSFLKFISMSLCLILRL